MSCLRSLSSPVQLEYSNKELRITLEIVERLVPHENEVNAAQHINFLEKMIDTLMHFLAWFGPSIDRKSPNYMNS